MGRGVHEAVGARSEEGPVVRECTMPRRLRFVRLGLASVALGTAVLAVLPGMAQAAKAVPTYYVSVGDSYSVGYQPGLGATSGYTEYVTTKTHLTLLYFAHLAGTCA